MTPQRLAISGGVAAAVLAYVLIAAVTPSRASEQRVLTGRASGAGNVRVDLPLGNVRVEADDEHDVRAELTLAGDADGINATRLRVEPVAGGVNVAVIYPQQPMRHLNASLTVRVPRSTNLSVDDHLGTILVSGVADATLLSRMGNVTVRDVRGTLAATSSMGNVNATIPARWNGKSIRCESRMGNVRLRVPPDLRATYALSTSMGRVRNAATSSADGIPVQLHSAMGNVSVATSDAS